MDNSVKISVIIPTWNRAEYLKIAVESALCQDYSDFEVIITDNASTDQTQLVAESFLSENRVRYYRNSKNVGARSNYNNAMFQYATGNYVLILSDDDKLTDRSFLSKAANLIKSSPDVVLVSANFRYINLENGNILSVTQMNTPAPIVDGKWLWMNYNIQAWCPMLTTVFSREQALRVGGFFMDIPGVDMLLFLHLLLNGRACIISDVVADYGVHAKNLSKSLTQSLSLAYENLDRIRLSARYALKQGLDEAAVERWKQRMMISGLRQIVWDFCLGPAIKGEHLLLSQIYHIAKQYGECGYLHYAMSSVIMLLADRTNLKENYRTMDLTVG